MDKIDTSYKYKPLSNGDRFNRFSKTATIGHFEQKQGHYYTIFRKADHLLRKIENAVDFSKIYDLVENLYCPDNGRSSIDPVVPFKMVIIQHLYGLPSLRRTAEEVKLNITYR